MSFWQRPDVVDKIREQVDFDKLERFRTERKSWIHSKHWGPITQSLSKLPELAANVAGPETILDQAWVQFTSQNALPDAEFEKLDSIAQTLMPWRKGPFEILDLKIDAEWQSNLKFDRIDDALGNLTNKKVLDIGCGNGYYMFRALAKDPDFILGLDPSVPFLLQFEFIQHFVQSPQLQIELLGAEHVDCFEQAFDVILCMGILYHQRNPLQILKDIWQATRPGGFAIIESQVIPGEDDVALFPVDRYAKARNVFFVPTVNCMTNWIKRAGFTEPETLSVDRTTFDEQRKTRWTTFESLEDFLDPTDPSKTVEGYPAPWRAAIKAFRPE